MFLFPFAQSVYAAAGQPAAGAEQPSFIVQMIPFLMIATIFYLLIIRPQQKKAKAHRKMLTELKRGDKVTLSSGIMGRISKTFSDKNFVLVDIDENVTVKVLKEHVMMVGEGVAASKPENNQSKNKTEVKSDDKADSDEDTKGEQPKPRRSRRSGRGGQRKGPASGDNASNQAKPEGASARNQGSVETPSKKDN